MWYGLPQWMHMGQCAPWTCRTQLDLWTGPVSIWWNGCWKEEGVEITAPGVYVALDICAKHRMTTRTWSAYSILAHYAIHISAVEVRSRCNLPCFDLKRVQKSSVSSYTHLQYTPCLGPTCKYCWCGMAAIDSTLPARKLRGGAALQTFVCFSLVECVASCSACMPCAFVRLPCTVTKESRDNGRLLDCRASWLLHLLEETSLYSPAWGVLAEYGCTGWQKELSLSRQFTGRPIKSPTQDRYDFTTLYSLTV